MKKPIMLVGIVFLVCLLCTILVAGVAGFMYMMSPTVEGAIDKTVQEKNFKMVGKIESKSGSNSYTSNVETEYVSEDRYYTIIKSEIEAEGFSSSDSQILSYETLHDGKNYYSKTNSSEEDSYGIYNVWTKYTEDDANDDSEFNSGKFLKSFKDTEIDLNKKFPFGSGEVVYEIENGTEFFKKISDSISGYSSEDSTEVKDVKLTLKAEGGRITYIKLEGKGDENGEETTFVMEFTLSGFGDQNIDDKLEEVKDAKSYEDVYNFDYEVLE